MKYKKIVSLQEYKVNKAELYIQALGKSFQFWVDKLDCSTSMSRQRIDMPFSSVLQLCIESPKSHWTILYRDKVLHEDIPYWEFGVNSMGDVSYFIWIKVNNEAAEAIFKQFDLEVQEY